MTADLARPPPMLRAMARIETRYVCQSCAAESFRWGGQCRACGEWNTLVETAITSDARRALGPRSSHTVASPVPLRDLSTDTASRTPLGNGELDRVLGGGVVSGSLILLAGEPGIGKSTLALGAAAGLAERMGDPILYVSGEESPGQVHLRATRLGIANGAVGGLLRILASSDVDAVVDAARGLKPAFLVVDSIQALTAADLDGPAGSVGQVREAAQRLLALAKTERMPVLIVGHVTKDGSVAGPKTLEHMVDVVLGLEGDPGAAVRLLRATKNRFGSTEEVGLFEMVGEGLRPLPDAAELFAPAITARPPGSAVALLLEGSRPLLVEVQALVGGSGYGPPRRASTGIELDRIALLTAVLAKRAGVVVGTHDVYASLAGGLRSREPALDLALALAIASSLRDRPLATGVTAGAEISLSGELRPVPGLDRRLREAARLGYRRAIVAGDGLRQLDGLSVIGVPTLRAALDAALETGTTPVAGRLIAQPLAAVGVGGDRPE